MPSGGRRSTTWKKGEKPPKRSPGRPKGSKDAVPRTFKGSIKRIFEEIATDDPDLIYRAMVKGLKASAPKSFQYLQLLRASIDGKEDDVVAFRQVQQLIVQMMALFIEIVEDRELRIRFATGVRRLTGLVEAKAIDAESTSQN